MKLAYLINQYPGISHSFVRREIQALERTGLSIVRFTIRPSKTAIIAEEDKHEQRITKAIVGAPALTLLTTLCKSLVRWPLPAIKVFFTALRLGWRSEAGLLRHVFYFLEALILADWLRAENINHIHAHFGTNSATVAMLTAIILDGSFSVTVHGPEEFDKPGLISLKEKIEQAAFVVAISNYGRSQLMRLVTPGYWEKIKIVHCGIETEFHDGNKASLPDNNRFVCVGRLSEQKGQLTLVKAAALLKEKNPSFEIILIGDGEMRPLIEEEINHHSLGENITLSGWKTPGEVRQAIENARIFLLPSYAEGLPVSIMEAFMLNRPVISTYIAGIPELVEPGVNGWLAPAGDATALAQIMQEALNMDTETILKMGQRGQEKTLARHQIDREAEKLKNHFLALKGSDL